MSRFALSRRATKKEGGLGAEHLTPSLAAVGRSLEDGLDFAGEQPIPTTRRHRNQKACRHAQKLFCKMLCWCWVLGQFAWLRG